MVHSGDVVSSPSGASEFIDVDLSTVAAQYVVPQVNVYDGEGFDQVEESFFGFMERDPGQRGRPFEPRAVRAKSALFGAGRVSLPVLFFRGDDGAWHAKWMHLNLSGRLHFNRVEGNAGTTSLLVRAVAQRRYLTLAYLEQLMRDGGAGTAAAGDRAPVTYLGLERPEGLPAGSTVITPGELPQLLNSA
jgi:hypothetical protein